MAVRLSTGLVNSMGVTSSFKGTFEATVGFVIDIYSGVQPTTADEAPTGTKLATISNNSAGTFITFEAAASNGSILKKTSETWSGLGLANNTAGWFRVRKLDDTNAVSTTFPRFDGACATSGSQLTMGSLTVSTGAPVTVTAASFSFPKS